MGENFLQFIESVNIKVVMQKSLLFLMDIIDRFYTIVGKCEKTFKALSTCDWNLFSNGKGKLFLCGYICFLLAR